MRIMSAAARVGLIVIVFLALGAYAISFLRQDAGDSPNRYRVVMQDASGLSEGSRVLLAGVEVGRVRKIGLNDAGLAEAVIEVRKEVVLKRGVTAQIPTSLVSIGVTELRLEQPTNASAVHDPNTPIIGVVANPLADMIPDLEPTMKEVNKTLVAVQGLLADEELKGSITDTLKEGQNTARAFTSLAHRLDRTLAQNQSTLRTTLITASNTLKDLQAVSAEVNRMITNGELEGRLTRMMDTMDRTLSSAERLVAQVEELASDPSIADNMRQTLENVRVASESAPRLAADAETIAANGATVSEEAVALMRRANEMAEEVSDLIEKFNNTLDRFGAGLSGGAVLPGVTVDADAIRQESPARIRTDVTATVPLSAREDLVIGFYDAFESNKITAQLRRPFGPSTDLRYGVYAGRPGVGVDYRASNRIGLRTDIFGLNDTQFDSRLQYEFGQGIRGYLGMDDIFRRNRLTVGVGIRR